MRLRVYVYASTCVCSVRKACIIRTGDAIIPRQTLQRASIHSPDATDVGSAAVDPLQLLLQAYQCSLELIDDAYKLRKYSSSRLRNCTGEMVTQSIRFNQAISIAYNDIFKWPLNV